VKRTPRRGEVWWVALDPALGTEIRKTRPAIVVSNDSCNRFGSRVVVVPVTGNVESLYPGEAVVDIAGKPARALGDQIRSVDRARLRTRLGVLSAEELRLVVDALRVTLDIPTE
jgi:mRNA interferase MazF